MTDDTEGDSPTGDVLCKTDELLKRTLTMLSMSVSLEPLRAKGARTKVEELTPLLPRGEAPSRSCQHSRQYMISLAWASNHYLAGAAFCETLLPSRGLGQNRQFSYPLVPKAYPRWEMKVLASHSRFGGCIFEAGSHSRQNLRGTLDVAWIDAIKDVASNACEVNWPRGPHLGHAPRSELRDITSCVRRTCVLRDESTRLEIVHQASRPARREAGRVREIRHSQLAIRGFREVHDRGVLTRCQANASDEVAVEESREYLKNSHLGTPERILVHREWFDGGHVHDFNLLCQATYAPSDATATGAIPIHFLKKYRKLGAERVK